MPVRILALVTLICAAPLPATTFENVTTAELARRSERVAVVKCESCRAERDRHSGLVFTHVRLTLLEDLKGQSAGSTLELRLIGGEADGVRTVVVGMPVFCVGEECILLLGKRNAAGHPTVVAARRGMVRLQRDKQGKRFLRDRVSGFDGLPRTRRRVELGAFRTAFRAAMRAKPKPGPEKKAGSQQKPAPKEKPRPKGDSK